MAFGILSVVGIVVLAVVAAVVLRQEEIETWCKQMGNSTLVLAEHASQTMASSYIALDGIAERVRAAGAQSPEEFRKLMTTRQYFRLLNDKTETLPQVDVATIVADNGDVLNFTRSFPAPKINLADRDYFKAQSKGHDAANFISIPNKGNGKWVFYISRRIDDSRGNMLGLVLVGTSVDVFSDFYQRVGINLGAGASITLLRKDLALLTRWPRKDALNGVVNKVGASAIVINKMKKDEAVIYNSGPRFSAEGRNIARIGAVRLVPRYPLVVNMTVTSDFFLANWRHTVKGVAIIAIFCIIALLWGIRAIVAVQRQREQDLALTLELKRSAEAASRQERVPRQHEPRDPHPDERHHRHDRAGCCDTRADARAARVPRTIVKASAESLLTDHQRHPRLLEDRGGQARPRAGRLPPARRRWTTPARLLALRAAREGPGAGLPHRPGRARRAASATRCGCARCSSTWSATRSSSPSAARSSSTSSADGADGDGAVLRLHGPRHRHRHPAPTSCERSSSRSRRPTARRPRKFGGTGLGLTISHAAGRADGRADLGRERAGRGSPSSFTARFAGGPVPRPARDRAGELRGPAGAGGGRPCRQPADAGGLVLPVGDGGLAGRGRGRGAGEACLAAGGARAAAPAADRSQHAGDRRLGPLQAGARGKGLRRGADRDHAQRRHPRRCPALPRGRHPGVPPASR